MPRFRTRPGAQAPRSRSVRAVRRRLEAVLRRGVVALALMSAPGVLAQAEWQVDVLIPDTISVRAATQEIAFGLTHAVYPPASFPATYSATLPEGGVLDVEVFASAEGSWSLLLEIPDLVDDAGRGVIPADQVRYRVDDGLWMRGSPLPQVIHSEIGPTDGWRRLRIAFELELLGTEPPGRFAVTTLLTALGESGTP